MTKDERQLIRQIYQSIPKPEEKEIFYDVMASAKLDRDARIKILDEIMKHINMPLKDQAVLLTATLTKEDRIMIFSNMVRQWIFSILGL